MKRNENLVLIGSRVILVPYKKEHVEKYHEWMQSPFLQEMTASEPLTLEEEYAMQESWHQDENKCTFILLARDETGERGPMIGDVNLFFNDPDEDRSFGEIEIMIAEEGYRRGKRGLEALQLMMAYAITELGLKHFHAKISLSNQPSVTLFTEKLGYYPVSTSEVFGETTLEWSLEPQQVEDGYGSKATPEQRERIEEIKTALLDKWAQVDKATYDKLEQ
ncbi:GNAT domain-domain-containing protein [Syncephalastrum racemosum]|uniref:GNAT domain-domain-containing protein n=1 Tax=Syncephalastrum racemosum TaxID=13706 RepID=A0A1X2HEF5_SYNRA|nr:GNAT domain-domain-containing protein [Syncephalastrum racemosum]